MAKKYSTRKALIASVFSLVLCFSMLLGTTLAWFSDSVTSTNNIIKSGTLDVKFEWAKGIEDPDSLSAAYIDIEADGQNVIYGDNVLWEPGYADAKHFRISNVGNLALKYQLRIIPNFTEAKYLKLAEVIDVYYIGDATEPVTSRSELSDNDKIGTLLDVMNSIYQEGKFLGDLKADEKDIVTVVLKMQETAGNEYQGLSLGEGFTIQLIAAQDTVETDSFDDQYDKNPSSNYGKTNVGPYKLNVLSGGEATYDEATKTYNVSVSTVAQGGYNASQGGKYYAGYTVNVAGYGENASVSFDKPTGEVVWKLADEERDGFITNGVHQQWTSVGTSRAYRYDVDGDGVTDFTVVNDASAAKVEASDAAQLKKVLEAGVSAVLTADVTMDVAETGITVAKDITATLDLNGHDIIATSTATEGVQLFSVSGNLDIVGDGTISLKNDNFAWTESYRYTAINIRETGVVTLGEDVKVVCEAGAATQKGYAMAYAVDIYTTGTLTVNGASLHSNYIAVRCFYGNSVVNVNSGSTITSSNNNYGIWPQSAPGATITIAPDVAYTTDSYGYGIYIFG